MRMRQHFLRLAFLAAALYAIALSAGCVTGTRIVPGGMGRVGIRLVSIASGMTSPLFLTNAHDGSGRLFILEQPGRIRIIPRGGTVPMANPFLDLTAKVLSGGERGLLGMAFHPQFRSNLRFFVDYTRIPDGATVISEFKASAANPNIAETDERVLLTIPQPFDNHNGGMIEFGADGFLYIGMGDGGSSFDPGNRAQNIDELLGKILRIDVDNAGGTAPYSSPADNPFSGSTPGRDEIFAYGFRNPYRFSFDRSTGDLYAGDVGQDMREEIDIVSRGGNYGWRVFEGTQCTMIDPCNAGTFIPPIYEYDHSNGRCAVTGGYVYRGSRGTFPNGSYIFGDFCSGEIFLLSGNAASLLLDSDLSLSSFGEDEDGEIYAVDLNGSVYRLAVSGVASTVSAASFAGGQVAAGSLAVGLGSGFSNRTATNSDGRGAMSLAGVTVMVKDMFGSFRQALIHQVSPTQIYHEIPAETALGQATIVYAGAETGEVATSHVEITSVSPGLMSANGSGSWIANAEVGRMNSGLPSTIIPIFRKVSDDIVPIAVDVGSERDAVLLGIYGTGFRANKGDVSVAVGGTPVSVFFAGGDANGTTLDRLLVVLPSSLAGRGLVDLEMTVDGVKSNTVKVDIK